MRPYRQREARGARQREALGLGRSAAATADASCRETGAVRPGLCGRRASIARHTFFVDTVDGFATRRKRLGASQRVQRAPVACLCFGRARAAGGPAHHGRFAWPQPGRHPVLVFLSTTSDRGLERPYLAVWWFESLAWSWGGDGEDGRFLSAARRARPAGVQRDGVDSLCASAERWMASVIDRFAAGGLRVSHSPSAFLTESSVWEGAGVGA